MLKVHSFTFNPYQENTYIVCDNDNNCAIIDPGMSDYKEEQVLGSFITANNLNPVLLLNTHCHIDHVLGNKFVFDNYNLLPQFHEGELTTFISVVNYAPQMGMRYEQAPISQTFLPSAGHVKIGEETLEIIFCPGHSPAHLCFYGKDEAFLIGGDVLFRSSIGRTDLPGGNHEQLLENIQKQLYTLPDHTIVYPGHGPTTTIGFEKSNNPFVRA